MTKTIEKTLHLYITQNSKIRGGEPVIKGTRFPVSSVVFYVVKQGMLPEELAQEFSQLSLSAIYEALSYYYDNKEKIDELLEENKEEL